jgi:HD superfamily phosphohydrolase
MIIYDNIHGYINIDELASSIIETPIFQRLRNIHQTGVLYLVFPTARHSRFEHSIGTYYLSKLMITNIKNSNKELNISEEIISLVSIAGLCHDLGHLLFSHLFDNEFIPNLEHYEQLKILTDNIYHQNRSTYLLKYLVIKYNINLNNDQLQIINDLINPNNYLLQYNKWNDKYKIGTWIFQIIANPINSIDVDKFDYITRDSYNIGLKLNFDYIKIINNAKVINNNICYSLKCSEDIYNMFFIRYRLHRQFYNHKACKAIEILLVKILFEIEKEQKISEYILEPEKMIKLIDSYIWHYPNDNLIIKRFFFSYFKIR